MRKKYPFYHGRHTIVRYQNLFGRRVPFLSVDSSHIDEIGYSPSRQKLYVRFWNGALYGYFRVTEQEWKGLVDAGERGPTYKKSKGKFFWKFFRQLKKYKQVVWIG